MKKVSKVHKTVLLCLAGISFLTCAVNFPAQETAATKIVITEGMPLTIVTTQDISSKDVARGDTVVFKVDEDFMAGGQVIVKKGTLAKGSVINAEKGGSLGKSGTLAIQVETTTMVDGGVLPLRAAKGSEGADKTNSAMAIGILAGPFALLKKGGEAIVKAGSKLTVYTAEERHFRLEGDKLVAELMETPATSNEPVTVYIYRPSKWVGRALEPSVFCDDVELARMDNGRFFMLKIKPGKHILRMTDEEKGYEINMGGGQVYYFRVGLEAGTWKGKGRLLLDDNEKGAAEVKKLKYLGADKIKDKTMIVAEVKEVKMK